MRPTPDTDSIVSSSLLHAAVSNLRSAATYGTDGNNRCIDPQSVTQLDKLCMLFISLLSMPRQSQIFKNIFSCRHAVNLIKRSYIHALSCPFLPFPPRAWCSVEVSSRDANWGLTETLPPAGRPRLYYVVIETGSRFGRPWWWETDREGERGGYIKIWIDTWRFSPGNVDEKFS